MQTNVGPSYGSFLLFHLLDGQSYPNSNLFPDTRSSNAGAYIESYQNPQCVRFIRSGYDPALAVYIEKELHPVRLTDTTNFPPSHDFNSGFYNYDISWGARDDRRYYSIRDSSIIFNTFTFHCFIWY